MQPRTYDRAIGQRRRMLPGPTAKASRARGAAGGKSGLGSRNDRKGPIHEHVSKWLAKEDVRTKAQSASSPDGRWEGVWERRKVEAGSPEWDAGRELRQAARRQASRERGLTMEPGTAIRSRKRASRGESRKVYASTFGAGRREGGARC
jgi:hypothetical protein